MLNFITYTNKYDQFLQRLLRHMIFLFKWLNKIICIRVSVLYKRNDYRINNLNIKVTIKNKKKNKRR